MTPPTPDDAPADAPDPSAELAWLASQARGQLELDRLLGVPGVLVPVLPPLALPAPATARPYTGQGPARHASPPAAARAPDAPVAPAPAAPAPVAPAPAGDEDPAALAARRQANEVRLEALARRMAGCTRCRLSEGRTNLVFGQGDAAAELAFVGEGPGYHEDQEGLAFVGKAGELLTKMIAAMGLTREGVFIANVVKCLSGLTRVRLADGSSERISKLVNERYDGEVLSVDPATGLIVPKRVVGWHRSPRDGRRLLKLRYRYGKRAGHKGEACTHLTEDHRVLTASGWVEAGQLAPGAKIATGEPRPGPRTEQLIHGTLLGDASVTRQLSLQHAIRQAEWLGMKSALLSPLGVRVSYAPQTNSVRLTTRAGAYWRYMRDYFYPEGRKVVPKDVARWLTDFALAVWFLDDGYLRERRNRRPAAEIATNSFSKEDVDLLLSALRALGIEGRTRPSSAGWRIFFDAEATLELSRRIAPMTPVSMRYKLHPDVRRIPFDASYYAPEPVQTFFDEAIVEPDETTFTAKEKSLFCIDVEDTHAFVTTGGVVHNCRPPGNRQPAPDEMGTCSPFLQEQLEIVRPKVICALGKTAAVGLGLIGPDEALGRSRGRFVDWRGTPAMITYHPAYLLRTPADKRKAWEDLQKLFPLLSRRRA